MIKLIACVDSEYGIAKNGTIPWAFKEDLKFFRQQTIDQVVIMGRRTFESLPIFPLPNRTNCIISKTLLPNSFATLEECLEIYTNAWIIGGAQLYNYALRKDLIDYMLLTVIKAVYNADLFLEKKHLGGFRKQVIFENKKYSIFKFLKGAPE